MQLSLLGRALGRAYRKPVDGPIALVKDSDPITFGRDKRLIELHVSARELAALKKKCKAPRPRHKDGILAEHAPCLVSKRGC
jgi:dihydroxyacid dehydratase/phosphogluconate dehydratase